LVKFRLNDILQADAKEEIVFGKQCQNSLLCKIFVEKLGWEGDFSQKSVTL
jgi:hypothetical protein